MKTEEILKKLIKEKGIPLSQIAKESNVPVSSYQRYLKGGSIRLINAIKIMKYFNVSLDYLAGRTKKRNRKQDY